MKKVLKYILIIVYVCLTFVGVAFIKVGVGYLNEQGFFWWLIGLAVISVVGYILYVTFGKGDKEEENDEEVEDDENKNN